MNNHTLTVDVREDIRHGREPFSRIMNAVGTLQNGDQLLLIAPFEPVPLYAVLGKQGFTHSVRPQDSGDWEVTFTRQFCPGPETPVPARPACPKGQAAITTTVEVDARGLEPPQPLVKILEAVADLAEDAQLVAHTDRRPMHLYAHLEERGFRAESQEQAEGSFLTYVRRN